MSQTELSMLGYEDMEEFKTHHKDFADLFIQKPGYIFKFKNFSWIDYSLHSGAPNKNVILKHKNGTEIETKLKISEIFLYDSINESQTLYGVEIVSESDSTIKLPISDTTPAPIQPAQEEKQEIKPPEELSQNEESLEEEIDKSSQFIVDEHISETEEDDIYLSTTDNTKIFSHNDVEESEVAELNESFIVDEGLIHPEIKLKIDDNLPEDNIEIKTEETDSSEDENDEVDFMKIAEETGLDLHTIASLIEEFILESKQAVIRIKNSNQDDLKENELLKLKGMTDSLKLENLSKSLNAILSKLKENEDIYEDLNLYLTKVQKLEESLL